MIRYFQTDYDRWRAGSAGIEIWNDIEWAPSIFTSIDELLACLDVVETDEDGNPITFESTLSKQDHADIKGEHELQIEKDLE